MIAGSLKKNLLASKSSKKWFAYFFTFAYLFLKFSQKIAGPIFHTCFFFWEPAIIFVIIEQRYGYHSYVILKKTYPVNLSIYTLFNWRFT